MRVLITGGRKQIEPPIVELRRRGEYEFVLVGEGAVAGLADETVDRPTAMGGRIEVILGAARGRSGELAWGDPAWALIEAVAASDAVLICGEEDSSAVTFLGERLLLTRLASEFNKPIVLTGQTVWPDLSGDDLEAMVEILSSAALIGLSNRPSFDAATRELDVAPGALRRTLDDELFSEGGRAYDESAPDGFVLVDLAGLEVFASGRTAAAFAELLDAAAKLTRSDLLVVDRAGVGASITDAITVGFRVSEGASATSEGPGQNAVLVITGDPALCRAALMAGVPFLAISTDVVTDRRLVHLAADFGLEEAVVPAATVVSGDAVAVVQAIASAGSDMAGVNLLDRRRAEAATWWDEVHSVLNGQAARPATVADVPPIELLTEVVRSRTAALRDLQLALAATADRAATAVRFAGGVVLAAESRVAALEAEVALIAAERDGVLAELAEAQLSLSAAHTAMVEFEYRRLPHRSADERAAGVRGPARATAMMRNGSGVVVRGVRRAIRLVGAPGDERPH